MISTNVWTSLHNSLAEEQKGIQSVIILHKNEVQLEEYKGGRRFQDLQKLYSGTKSICSLAMGIAIEENKISLQTPLEEILSAFDWGLFNSRKSKITLEHVLNQTTGFKWLETGRPWGPGHSGYDMEHSDNWADFVLQKDCTSQPGERFSYNTGVSHLMGYLIEELSGKHPEKFISEKLFAPLEIVEHTWTRDHHYYPQTGKGLSLKPFDFAKIGQFVLQKGTWQGRQILSENWINQSFSPQSKGHKYYGTYGYQWWLKNIPEGPSAYDVWSKDHNVFCAIGYGGQFLYIVPQWDLVVSITGNLIGAENFEIPQNIFKNDILKPLTHYFS